LLFKDWLQRYRAHGIGGLNYKDFRYSSELKQKIVWAVIEEPLSLHKASLDYKVARSVLKPFKS